MNSIRIPCSTGQVSDGYHTFDELYFHRNLLFVALMNSHRSISWKSKKNPDGSILKREWFIAGMDLPTGQTIYHMEVKKFWHLARVEELKTAPEWDGYTPDNVLQRLEAWQC